MPTPSEIRNLVERDVTTAFENIFAPDSADGPAFDLLDVGAFRFEEKDIAAEAGVAAVAWRWNGVHVLPVVGAAGRGFNDEEIPVLAPDPPVLSGDPFPVAAMSLPSFPATGRRVQIAGVTLVVTRDPGRGVDDPMLLRFVDWADVFSQLGFVLSARGPNPDTPPGFQRLSDAVADARRGAPES